MLIPGLLVLGVGIALMVRANLGLGPWDVFHQGISRHTGIPMGRTAIIVGLPIILLWWPLGYRPGIGAYLNSIEGTLRQSRRTREADADGILFFAMGDTKPWSILANSTNTVTNLAGFWSYTTTNGLPQRFYRGASVAPCP